MQGLCPAMRQTWNTGPEKVATEWVQIHSYYPKLQNKPSSRYWEKPNQNLLTFVELQCEFFFFTNSVDQFVLICSDEMQLSDSLEDLQLMCLFGGILKCSGGDAISPTLQPTCHVYCTLTYIQTAHSCAA